MWNIPYTEISRKKTALTDILTKISDMKYDSMAQFFIYLLELTPPRCCGREKGENAIPCWHFQQIDHC